jgi:hypothetical protein
MGNGALAIWPQATAPILDSTEGVQEGMMGGDEAVGLA